MYLSQANNFTGVMRFLQTEWHRHERDRNAWEIERGEMKTRIASLEGDVKKSKPTHDALSKHIKMLELALRKEREKVKSLSKGEEVDMKDAKELAREQLKAAGKGIALTQQKGTLLIRRSFRSRQIRQQRQHRVGEPASTRHQAGK
jgi:hypothetical protein